MVLLRSRPFLPTPDSDSPSLLRLAAAACVFTGVAACFFDDAEACGGHDVADNRADGSTDERISGAWQIFGRGAAAYLADGSADERIFSAWQICGARPTGWTDLRCLVYPRRRGLLHRGRRGSGTDLRRAVEEGIRRQRCDLVFGVRPTTLLHLFRGGAPP
jgi:hypothetical protein